MEVHDSEIAAMETSSECKKKQAVRLSGLSFLADGMDAFTFPKRSADSTEELNACLDALASDLSWLTVKSKIKALAAADVDNLCETLAALGGAQIKICGRDLIAADVKSIYNS